MKHLRKLLVPTALLSTMMIAACGEEAAPPMSVPEERLEEMPQATREVTPEPVAPMLPADPPAPVAETAPTETEQPEIDVPEVRMDETSADQATTYTVEAGDTLYSIARRHNVNTAQLMRWNEIDNPSLIQVGQEIKVSAGAAQ